MAIEPLRDTISKLQSSANALAALGAALDARANGTPLGSEIGPPVDEVVTALGVREALAAAEPSDLLPLLAEIRTFTLTNVKLLFAACRGAGWTYTEPELLQAAGDVSVGIPRTLERAAAHLPGLGERLASPNAAFLDIGVGVAALSIAMARRWPTLRVVGIDRWAPALALARDSVRAAGLMDRITLREQSAEELDDCEAFDLAWLPGAFIAQETIEVLVDRVHRALRPGGWLLLAIIHPPAGGDVLTAALARLRAAMFGGAATTPEAIAAVLRRRGFADVRALPRLPGSAAALMAARA